MEVSSWENHLFLWAIYTMAMLNNQMVYDSVVPKHSDYPLRMPSAWSRDYTVTYDCCLMLVITILYYYIILLYYITILYYYIMTCCMSSHHMTHHKKKKKKQRICRSQRHIFDHHAVFCQVDQWEFQDPKMEVPTIYKALYKAYVREYDHKI